MGAVLHPIAAGHDQGNLQRQRGQRRAAMKQLTGLDATFLHLENAT
ncbi:MAG: hypothetical protein QOD83_5026, partial [Solirubrobacteraceae bacterium]|nr:hypothetical protein [Solirubrobacteraceae bacterium]